MSSPRVNLYGTEYELATTLRVAYKIQGQNSHKPYTEIFQKLDSMTIEQQIGILYEAFEVANPSSTEEITRKKFLDWYLDNYNVSVVMQQLQAVIEGILGKDLKPNPDGDKTDTQNDNAGN